MEKWLSLWSIGQSRLPDDFKRIKEAGIVGVEIWAEHLNAEVFLDYAREANLKVSVHLPFHDLNIATPDLVVAERTSEVIQNWLKRIAQYNGDHAVIHGGYSWSIEERETAYQNVKERLAFLSSIAEENGVKLLLENLIPDRLNYCHFIASEIDEWIYLLNDTGLQACLDVGHLAVLGADLESTIKKLGKTLAAVHYSDNDGKADLHLLPGKGQNVASDLFHILDEINFSGPIIYEINPYQYSMDEIVTHIKNSTTF